MSWFDLIFGSFSPGNKIYRSTIAKIPGHEFNRSVRMKVNGGERQLVGEALRDQLARMASNGISYTSLDNKLKKAGVEGKQYERRREIIRTIKNAQQKNKQTKEVNKKEEDFNI